MYQWYLQLKVAYPLHGTTATTISRHSFLMGDCRSERQYRDITARGSNPSASKTRRTNSNSQSQRRFLHSASFTSFNKRMSHISAVKLMINRFLQHSSDRPRTGSRVYRGNRFRGLQRRSTCVQRSNYATMRCLNILIQHKFLDSNINSVPKSDGKDNEKWKIGALFHFI